MKTVKENAARKAVDNIIADLKDRRGLRQEWEGIDDDVQQEIRKVWRQIVLDAVEQ